MELFASVSKPLKVRELFSFLSSVYFFLISKYLSVSFVNSVPDRIAQSKIMILIMQDFTYPKSLLSKMSYIS